MPAVIVACSAEMIPPTMRSRTLPVYTHAAADRYSADHGPACRQLRAGRESGGQGVILTAGEHPAEPVPVPPARAASARPASTGAVLSASRTHAAAFFAGATAPHGRRTWRSALASGAQGRRSRHQLRIAGQQRAVDIDPHLAGRGHVPEILHETVADVDHRGRAEERGLRPGIVRRPRALVGRDESGGLRPDRSPSAVIAIRIASALLTSPPATEAPPRTDSCARPRTKSRAHCAGRSPGAAKPTSRAVGTAPIAAMSARFCAAALQPTSKADDQARRKCRPS